MRGEICNELFGTSLVLRPYALSMARLWSTSSRNFERSARSPIVIAKFGETCHWSCAYQALCSARK